MTRSLNREPVPAQGANGTPPNDRPLHGIRVVQVSSAHPRRDSRILYKICRSLVAAGGQVTLVVADGEGPETIDGVHVLDAGKPDGRLRRMLNGVKDVAALASCVEADVYHFHDPELLFALPSLRSKGKVVIYDAHEDLGRDVLGKTYLPGPTRPLVAAVAEVVEARLAGRCSAIVAATPHIAAKFRRQGRTAVTVSNFPILSELGPDGTAHPRGARKNVCYVGGIARKRGITELVEAMPLVKSGARLVLAGEFSEPAVEAAVKGRPGWASVDHLGWLSRADVKRVLASVAAGLVTLHPTSAYKDALPVKMFEYMAAGIPVIASDFPLWRSIIAKVDCGLLVDPMNPAAIAAAIDWVEAHPDEASAMGDRGRQAVLEQFNWEPEFKRLTDLYLDLVHRHDN